MDYASGTISKFYMIYLVNLQLINKKQEIDGKVNISTLKLKSSVRMYGCSVQGFVALHGSFGEGVFYVINR